MYGLKKDCVLDASNRYFTLEDYAGAVPRWCPGCGDHAVLTAVQRVCRDEQWMTTDWERRALTTWQALREAIRAQLELPGHGPMLWLGDQRPAEVLAEVEAAVAAMR